MKKFSMSKRWLFVAVASVAIASGGGFAVLSASAAEITTVSPNTIAAAHSGKCLTVPAAAGAATQQACSSAASARQTFQLTAVDGGYRIAPLAGTGCLSAPPSGSRLELVASCSGGTEQVFSASESGSGHALKNMATGTCVDVSRESKADGAEILLYRCHGKANQQWRLTATGTPDPSPSAGSPSPTPPTTPSVSPSVTTSPSASVGVSPSTSAGVPAGTNCARQSGASPQVKISEVNLGVAVTGYGQEGDTENLPMAIAAVPDGTSWLAWLGTDGKVYLGRVDCDDKLVGAPTSFTGIDLQDVQADATGGVLLLTRKGDCGTGPLCGGSSSPCNTMHMIRFDSSGQQVWEQQVTNLTGGRTGYDDGARFIWWYQHHGRLATNGSDWAAYFGVAITVKNGNCVDIHEGDRMQVVDAKGALVSGKGSFNFGCSHAWDSRIVWDPKAGRFVMVCATDNDCRIAQPDPYRTVAAGTCDGTLFGGDLVLAKDSGYWTAWSQGGAARLEHFTSGASDSTVMTAAATRHPHLTGYGPGRMLLAWESGSTMLAQAYDSGSGKTVGAQFPIAVRDHNYQAFKAYADGSAAYPAAGSSNTTIKIARVMPLAS